MNKIRFSGTAAVLAAAVLAASPALAEGLKLGALMPMTGGLQAYGESSFNGVKLAEDEINKAGGVLGGKLEIVVGDTQTTPQPGVDAAQKLVSIEKVKGIVSSKSAA